jgi:TldD protein
MDADDASSAELAALAERAVDAAMAAGARYADARGIVARREGIAVRNEALERVDRRERAGVGVRALIGSSWGFFATQELTPAAVAGAGTEATRIAEASGLVAGDPFELADVPVAHASWTTPYRVHPLDDVSLADKVDLLLRATAAMRETPGVQQARAFTDATDTDKWFVSSQGHRVHQRLVDCGGGIDAMAIGDDETQRRSYPQSFGHYEIGGWDVVEGFDLVGAAPRIAEETVALLSAPVCPAGVTDLVLEGSQVALQIHESVGHAIELDRILGWEAAFAGTSFLDLAQLGRLRYGSELMQITADATLPRALSTFAYDDEGTPAQSVDIVRDGVWVGVLSGRDSAAIAGLPPGGMVRADGYDRIPMVRMTNVGIRPGPSSLAEIVAATDDGIYMATNRSWSIDDKRLNFQFGCEVAWEIKGGRLGRMLRNPTYTGITPVFWAGLDMLAGGDEWVPWGVPNCGKGQPMQVARTGHPAAPARFRGVRVGVRG